jgi:hypothetical protein
VCAHHIPASSARGAIFGLHFVISSGKRRLVFSHFNCERSLNKNMPVASVPAHLILAESHIQSARKFVLVWTNGIRIYVRVNLQQPKTLLYRSDVNA